MALCRIPYFRAMTPVNYITPSFLMMPRANSSAMKTSIWMHGLWTTRFDKFNTHVSGRANTDKNTDCNISKNESEWHGSWSPTMRIISVAVVRDFRSINCVREADEGICNVEDTFAGLFYRPIISWIVIVSREGSHDKCNTRHESIHWFSLKIVTV